MTAMFFLSTNNIHFSRKRKHFHLNCATPTLEIIYQKPTICL